MVIPARAGESDALAAGPEDGRPVLLLCAMPGPQSAADHHANALCVETGDAFIGETAAPGVERHIEGPYRCEVLADVSHWISEQAPDRLSLLLLEHPAAW